jgi:bifunctional DNA-binding transcriptional regulator/antitoxin component of YhaV-PrlF toxin-antitoxin module
VSAKHQVTIPVDAMRAAGIRAGDRLVARATGPGQVVLEREVDPMEQFAGALAGVYRDGYLESLRGEWD